MRRRTFDRRTLAGLAGIGILLAGIGLLARESRQTIDRSSRAVLAENVSSLKAAAELELVLLDQKGIVANFLLAPDPRWIRLLEEKRADFECWFAAARDVAFTQPERRIVHRIATLYDEYTRLRDWVVVLAEENRTAEAALVHANEIWPRVEEIHAACEELLALNERLIADAQATNARKLARLEAGIWVGIGAAALLGGLLAALHHRRATRRIVEAEKFAALGQMAGFVAHEIRNPLTAIRLRVDTLRGDGLSPSSLEDVEVINQEIGRLDRVVGKFLDLARRPSRPRDLVPVHAIAAGAIDALLPTLAAKRIQVVTRFDDRIPPVPVDREELKQVFLNLFLNSAEAMPDGGTLTVETGWQGHPGEPGEVVVRVRDTGPGVPRRLRKRLFDPFFTTKPTGTGLGLPIALKIVQEHQGSIEFESSAGAGAVVAVRLPALAGAGSPS
ncbi:MAG TPA: ATP-binding protein [Planctomycetota bacterium]|nr:ATP-binding protein [Planctomycetota bacterium]